MAFSFRKTFHFVIWISAATASCYDPSPAFPVPSWTNGAADLSLGFESIEKRIKDTIVAEKYDTTSFSIEITSNTETLWSQFHTARKLNETRPGDTDVDENSQYRIASISKVFTVLSLLYQHEAGTLSLDDPISDYVPHLRGEIPWNDITLRILASQLSGIPREFAQGDLMNELPEPTELGLPPLSNRHGLPTCDEYHDYIPACNRKDLLQQLKRQTPLFAPNQKSTYSNVNYELLGLAIENVTGMNFTSYVQKAIFDPLEMKASSFDTPPDTHAVIPRGNNYWGIDAGVQNPTGGIYSSTSDMSKLVRYILTHYNAIATGVNWILPSSFAEGLQTFYGMPFEIFRTDKILKESKRPVTFVTKSGGLQAYCSRVSLMPEHGLGLTILVGGECTLLNKLQEITTVALVRAAEAAIWKDVDNVYSGFYTAVDPSLNSSLHLTASPSTGLVIESFISNNTDVLKEAVAHYFVDGSRPWRAQLSPTLLFKDENRQRGEIFRIVGVYDRTTDDRGIWDDMCTTDIDIYLYGGLPITEVVFWHEERLVELPAWKLKMRHTQHDGDTEILTQQN